MSARQAYRQWRLALAAARVDQALEEAAQEGKGKDALRLASIMFTLHAPSTTDKWITGGLSALGSLLSGFVAATFFKAAAAANHQMIIYYLEPQRTGRLLATERLVSSIRKDAEAPLEPDFLKEIVAKVLTWEIPLEGGSALLSGNGDNGNSANGKKGQPQPAQT